MSSDNQFTAIGQAEIGFQTNSASIRIGADIAGNELGVVGRCKNGPGVFGQSIADIGVKATSTSKEAIQGTSGLSIGVSGDGGPGVFGHGRQIENAPPESRNNGVMGVTEGDGAGVFGGHRSPDLQTPLTIRTFPEVEHPGAGVFGLSIDDANGVVGQSREGHGVVGTSAGGVEFKNNGVFGRSDKIAGVVGISGLIGSEEKFTAAFGVAGQAGVVGFSELGTGVLGSSVGRATHGVRGSSINGDGISGTSRRGRGGVFQSGGEGVTTLVPQLQLVPQLMSVPIAAKRPDPRIFEPSRKVLPALPQSGQGGDMLVTKDKNGASTLWFCVQAQDGNTAAVWRQVLLGEPVLP